jgi:uncharacterized protein YbaP (TraB family)
MLWEIVGTPHRLLGSMHVLPETVLLPNWVTASHNGIERFVFEADIYSPLGKEIGVDPSRAHLKLLGVSELYERTKKLLASLGSVEPFEALRPWKAAFYVASRLYLTLGLLHPQGIDSRSARF